MNEVELGLDFVAPDVVNRTRLLIHNQMLRAGRKPATDKPSEIKSRKRREEREREKKEREKRERAVLSEL